MAGGTVGGTAPDGQRNRTAPPQHNRHAERPGRADAIVRRLVAPGVVLTTLLLIAAQAPVDSHPLPPRQGPPPHAATMAAHSARFDLRHLQPGAQQLSPDAVAEGDEPQVDVTGDLAQIGAGVDTASGDPGPTTGMNFDGLAFSDTCTGGQCGAGHPPDTNGDVGPTYYIEAVNTAIGIFSKSTGSLVASLTFNTLMSQGHFGNLCDTNNFGDPVVVYDSFTDHWIISDFAFEIDGSGNIISPPGSFQCFAVSQTGDPVSGGWNFYSLAISDALNDYPKLGIWRDGLYMSANMFSFAGETFQNSRVWALDKAAMEAGQTATVLSFDAAAKTGPCGVFTLLPANARAQAGAPPVGTPEYFASTWCYTNRVRVWSLHADFGTPNNSTFTGPVDSTTSTTWSTPPDSVPELGGNALDTLAMRAMMQAQYSNIGGVESLWVTHTVAGSSSTQAAVRWYQVPVTGGTIGTALQASTYNPDSSNRWLASLAVDRIGDMAIGYSVSDATMDPAIRYAGRLSTDPANTLGVAETSLIEGTGAQVGNCGGAACGRWGDYSAMTLDPDGCTFWYTNEYYAANGLNDHTRIGSFSFPACTSSPAPTPTASPAPTPTASPTTRPTATPTARPSATPTAAPTASPTARPTASPTASATAAADVTPPSVTTPLLSPSTAIPGTSVTVTATASDSSGVASAQDRLASGSWVAMSAADGGFGGTSESLTANVTAPSAAGTYQVCVRATDGSPNVNQSDGSACATLTVKTFSLSASPSSLTVPQGSSTTSTVTITRSSFPDSITFSASGLPAGASATFSTNPTSGGSTVLTLAASNCGTVTARGTYPITIHGSGAGLTSSTSVSMTVTNGGPTFAAVPSSRLVAISTLGTSTVPVRTTWSACDPNGIALYRLQRQVNGGGWYNVTLSSGLATSITQSLSRNTSYRYRIEAEDKTGIFSHWIYGPTFEPVVTDQTSSLIAWSGSWHTVTLSGTYGGTTRYSTSAGSSTSFTFTGASIGWVSARGPNRGSARIYIDGVLKATVSLYASTYSYRQIVWSMNWSSRVARTITVVVVGTAGHPRVDVDGFVRL